VPALLRTHACAAMRKAAMLCLAHAWRYKSDCWSAKGGGATGDCAGAGARVVAPPAAPARAAVGARGEASPERKRARLQPGGAAAAATAAAHLPPARACSADSGRGSVCAAADDACTGLALATSSRRRPQQPRSSSDGAAALALHDRTFATLQGAQCAVHSLLVPLIAAAASGWVGPASRVEYGRCSGEGLTWLRVRTIEGAADVGGWLGSICALRLAALRAWRDTLGEDALRQPAYTVDAAYNSPESELEALRHIIAQSSQSTHAAAAALTLPDGSLLPRDAAWVDDFHRGRDAALALIAQSQAFIAAQRMQPLRSFLDASEAVLIGMCLYTRDTYDALRARMAWASDMCAAQGPAAGDWAQAQASAPPLIARLRLCKDTAEGARLLALAHTPLPRGEPPPRFVLGAPPDL
jgi:hypothetical protein